MPWRCPACRSEIRHNSSDKLPNAAETYRCHVCRLELVFDETFEKMVIAPLETDHHIEPPAKPRKIPVPALDVKKRAPKPRGR
jgi:hypothetical protein